MTEIIDAIQNSDFEKARQLLSSIRSPEIIEQLEALCFNDYLYIKQPTKVEVDHYIAQSTNASVKGLLEEIYARYTSFQNIFKEVPNAV